MGKRPYEKPTIIPHVSGLANKFGRAHTLRVKKDIDGVPVKEMLNKFGSPVFAFSEKTIRRLYRKAVRAFETRYPMVQFAWSYKTNYLDAICKIYHQEGAWAEVVSEFEYEMAKKNGIQGTNIIYNGPFKPEPALRQAVEDGARIHIDHYDELFLLEKIAQELNCTIPVGIRINMDTGIYPSWDRFGFNLDNGEALSAVKRLHSGGKLKLVGIHAHIGTFVTEPSAYRNEAFKLGEFSKIIQRELGFTIDYIDVGGGFSSKNTLLSQYSPGRESNPPIEAYADAITSALLSSNFDPATIPLLVLETGRALIDEAGYLLTTVVGNKRLPNGTRMMIVDAGVNTLFTAFWYKHDIMLAEERTGMFEETAIYGPLCMNIDVVRPSIRLPALDAGDHLLIHPVGAYNVTQWMQFIRMRPAVVLVTEEGEAEIIRQAETLETVKSLERVPDKLKLI